MASISSRRQFIVLPTFCFCLILYLPLSVQAQSRAEAEASVYQYEAPAGTKKSYLWIPSKCTRVSGLIVSFSNLLERNWLEDPIIRKAANGQSLGMLLIEASANGITPELKPEGKACFLKLLKDLAAVSGYPEIEFVPFIPIEHSIHSVFCWNLANWLPQRTIAAIPVKGAPFPSDVNLAGIPMCYIVGENDEWPPVKDGKPWSRDYIWPQIRHSATVLRKGNANNLVAVVTDPGGGHLDWSAKLSEFMALYITKACKYRLPAKTSLQSINALIKIASETGWLTDTAGLDADEYKPAPYNQYKGEKQGAYWFFDKKLAQAAVNFAGDRRPYKKQMVSFIQNDTVVALAGKPFVSLQFKPAENGTTFYAKGGFYDKVPVDFVDAGMPLGHANTEVELRVITGPAIKTAANTFEISLNRSAMGGDVWLQASQPGDDEYSKAVQPAQIKLPSSFILDGSKGINFPVIENQKAKLGERIKLKATSTSGLPIKYFVRCGPAFIDGNDLVITRIPVKSKYPVKISVVAWQWDIRPTSQNKGFNVLAREFYLLK